MTYAMGEMWNGRRGGVGEGEGEGEEEGMEWEHEKGEWEGVTDCSTGQSGGRYEPGSPVCLT